MTPCRVVRVAAGTMLARSGAAGIVAVEAQMVGVGAGEGAVGTGTMLVGEALAVA